MANRVLIVDDEKLIVKGVRFSLLHEGMEVDTAYDGEEGLTKALSNNYDIILLDIMLPKMNGFDVCRQIREVSDVPIIMLTAKGEDMDKIMGLEYGADDYLTKPFNILELKARIRAILRRTGSKRRYEDEEQRIKIGNLEIDENRRSIYVSGHMVDMTVKEFELLRLLMKNPNKVFTRDELLNQVWGYEYPGDIRTVDVHIRRIREKIEENPAKPSCILTKWGVGYYFRLK